MKRRSVIAASLAVLLLGGYAAADTYDVVPGFLTTDPARPPVTPYPEPVAQGPADGVRDAKLTTLPGDAPMPEAGAVRDEIDGIVKKADLGKDLGVDIRDAESGEQLYEQDSGKPHTPASVTKVLTSSAALAAIGSNTTFATTAVPDGDTLVLRGGGDAMLSTGKSDPEAVDGRAGLQTLADESAAALKKSGTDTVRVAYDESQYTGPGYHPSWAASDLGNGYAAPVSPLMVHAGRMKKGVDLSRTEEPGKFAAGAFAKSLEKAGISVDGDVEAGKAPEDADPIAQVESAPVSAIAKKLMVDSDNIVAEALGRQVAISAGEDPSFEGATRAVVAELDALGINTEGVSLADLSGLSYDNRITPRALTETVRLAATAQGPVAALSPTLPVAGYSGTLAERFRTDAEDDAAGKVHAKTGYLRTVTSLTGTLVTNDNRLVVFTLMSNGLDAKGTLKARGVLDEIAAALTECGCQ